MRFTTAIIAAFAGLAAAAPAKHIGHVGQLQRRNDYTQVRPGNEPIMEKENFLEGTRKSDQTLFVNNADIRQPVPADLNLSLVNNLGAGVNAYISGTDSDGAVVFIDGSGNLIYPSAGGSAVPVPVNEPIAIPLGGAGETLDIKIPISIESGRISFAVGELQFFTVSTPTGDGLVQPSITNPEDPSAGLNWGFSELTLTEENVIWANISYVDYVGLILSLDLAQTGGETISVVGLAGDSVPALCEQLTAQTAADGQPWGSTCMAGDDGNPLRVLSPEDYTAYDEGAFADYWSGYVDEVWSAFASRPLTINTQNGEVGAVTCQVNGDLLECEGDNRGYAKPSGADIWGCNGGPFAIQEGDNAVHYAVVPRLCAAFNRSNFLVEGGDVTPALGAESYYTVDPTNHYSRIIHANEVDGKGYAFPYDDVNPDGAPDASGLVSSATHERLTFYVGGKQ